MIGKLKGLVDGVEADTVIIDVGGVGYVCHCPTRTLQGLPGTGQAVEMFVETVVREDSIRLYGFSSLAERQWFNLLLTVQGVGARVADITAGVLKTAPVAPVTGMLSSPDSP